MSNRPPRQPDQHRLPEPVAERLLARASELDAADRGGSAVADLRAAAVEAGISAHAFDVALTEIQGAERARLAVATFQPRPRRRMRLLATVAAASIAVGGLALSRMLLPAEAAVRSAPATVEEAILLRCLSPGEAAELIRPLLRDRHASVVISPARAARVLTVRATPEQMQRVRAALDRYEGTGSPACTTGPVVAP
jgi:hypothetical protein